MLGKTNQTYFGQLTVFFYYGCFREFKNAILLVSFEMVKKTCACMGGVRKLPTTKIQLLALILLGLRCPLMSLIMLLAIPRYSTVKKEVAFTFSQSWHYLLEQLLLSVDTGITPGETIVQ